MWKKYLNLKNNNLELQYSKIPLFIANICIEVQIYREH